MINTKYLKIRLSGILKPLWNCWRPISVNGRLRLQCFSLNLNKFNFLLTMMLFCISFWSSNSFFKYQYLYSTTVVHCLYFNVQNIETFVRVSLWCTFIEQWPTLMHQSQQNKHTLCSTHNVPTWDLIDMSSPRLRPQRGKSDTIQLWIPHMYNRCGHFAPPFFFHPRKARRQEVGSSRVSEVRAFLSAARRRNEKAWLSGRCQRLLVADAAEASGL